MNARRVVRTGLAALLLPLAAAAGQRSTETGWPQPMNDDPLLAYAVLNQNEWRGGEDPGTYRWEGEGWIGHDLDRLWFKSEGDLDTDRGALSEAEVQALYSHAVSPYFNLQGGSRYDFAPGSSRGWAALGVEGLAPLFWEVGAFAFVSDSGHYGARLEGHYDLLLMQRLILQPQFEFNLYTRGDARSGIGAGLSDLDSGLRLRYEIRRQFAPYIGVVYEKRYGQSAGYARAAGERAESLRFVAGVRLRY